MHSGTSKAFKGSRDKKTFRTKGTAYGDAIAREWNRLLLNTWFVEVVAVIFSAACVIAIAIVLSVYDGKTQPNMPYGLTLNAIVSVLSTASKSALICAVAGALGQLKWIWFRRSRKLQDIQLFDDASRGPWGSVTLLGSLNIRTLASIGALVTVLALAFEPFVQQILKYPVRLVSSPHSGAVVTKNSLFNLWPYSNSFGRAVQTGLWSYDDNFQLPPSCPSGHCKWPPYRSVGLCTKCTDAMPYASISGCDTEAFWNGHTDNVACHLSFGHGNGVDFFSWPYP